MAQEKSYYCPAYYDSHKELYILDKSMKPTYKEFLNRGYKDSSLFFYVWDQKNYRFLQVFDEPLKYFFDKKDGQVKEFKETKEYKKEKKRHNSSLSKGKLYFEYFEANEKYVYKKMISFPCLDLYLDSQKLKEGLIIHKDSPEIFTEEIKYERILEYIKVVIMEIILMEFMKKFLIEYVIKMGLNISHIYILFFKKTDVKLQY